MLNRFNRSPPPTSLHSCEHTRRMQPLKYSQSILLLNKNTRNFILVMSLRRSRFEIYRELLPQVQDGDCQPNRIRYSTELPWYTFNQVMQTLIKQKFLVEVDQMDKGSRARYKVTEKGERFLKYLGEALNSVDMMEEIQFVNST